MQAVWFEKFGSASEALVFGELSKPQVAEGEVLVRLRTSGVNPSDTKKRAGAFPNLLDGGLVVPHSDGAGVIEQVGEGVDSARIGERVFIYQAQYGRSMGTAAEYVAIASERAPRLPDEASFEVGACIGIPMMTAHRCVFADGDVRGQTLLITGGAGRVGYYAVQWAKRSGARVIATASNEVDADLLKNIGADAVINHRDANWGEAVLAANNGQRIDRVIDVEFGANLPEVLKCLRIGGTIATYSSTQVAEPKLPFKEMMFMDLTVRMVIVYAMPESAKQHAITDTTLVLSGNEFSHRIANVVPLHKMVQAHELIENSGLRGCVVVSIE